MLEPAHSDVTSCLEFEARDLFKFWILIEAIHVICTQRVLVYSENSSFTHPQIKEILRFAQ